MDRRLLVYACAVLNSAFATLYFRTIQPRVGKLFAELKITHLEDIPLPFLDDPFAEEEGDRLLQSLENGDAARAAFASFESRFDSRLAAASPGLTSKLETCSV